MFVKQKWLEAEKVKRNLRNKMKQITLQVRSNNKLLILEQVKGGKMKIVTSSRSPSIESGKLKRGDLVQVTFRILSKKKW